MRYFSEMSTPDLEITREAYQGMKEALAYRMKLYDENKLQLLPPRTQEQLLRTNELLEAIENELQIRRS